MMKNPKKRRAAPGTWEMAFRNIGRHPRRSVLCVTAVALASLTVLLLLSLIAGLRLDMETTIQRYLSGQLMIQHKDLDRSSENSVSLFIPQVVQLQTQIKQVPGVLWTSPRIATVGSVFVEGDAVFFPVIGMDFKSDPAKVAEFLGSSGHYPGIGKREALISAAFAKRFSLSLGSPVTVVTQTVRGSSNGMTLQVTGIVDSDHYSIPTLFLDIETARRLVHLDDGATALLIGAAPKTDLAALSSQFETILKETKATELRVRAWNAGTSSTYDLMKTAETAYNFIGIFFFLLAATVIINTMLMIVMERRREIGTLLALGMDRSQIRRLFLAESAVLSGIGALVGIIVGSVIALILNQVGLDFSQAMKGVSLDTSSIFRPVLEPYIPVFVFLGATLVSVAFTFLPVKRINSMNITDSLKG